MFEQNKSFISVNTSFIKVLGYVIGDKQSVMKVLGCVMREKQRVIKELDYVMRDKESVIGERNPFIGQGGSYLFMNK